MSKAGSRAGSKGVFTEGPRSSRKLALAAAFVLLTAVVAAAAGFDANSARGVEAVMADNTAPEVGPLAEEDQSTAPRHEIVGDRTETSKTFSLPDGQMEARLYGAPVNFRNSDGEWKPIREVFERDDL